MLLVHREWRLVYVKWQKMVLVHREWHLVYVKWQKMLLVHREGHLVYVEGFGVWGSGEFIIFVVENNCCVYEYKVSFTCSCRGVFRWLQC